MMGDTKLNALRHIILNVRDTKLNAVCHTILNVCGEKLLQNVCNEMKRFITTC